jgi:hypothetical protein
MATPYSTVAECRLMVTKASTIAKISDPDVTAVIALADRKVKEDLSNVYDMAAVDLAATTPDPVNELSRFKTNEWVLVKLFGAKRSIEEVSDIQYWAEQYKMKLEQILEGLVDLGPLALATQAFTSTYKDDVTPALGHGKYGGWIDEDGLESVREEGTEEGPNDE